jgi:hypothetical protein
MSSARMTQSAIRSVIRYFPNAVLPLRGCSWRVEKLYGNQLPAVYSDDLRAAIADAIRRQYAMHADSQASALREIYEKFGLQAPSLGIVDASRVDIIEPGTGILYLWPPTFICSKCGTFYSVRDEPLTRCIECGNREFTQPVLIHVCRQCSRYEQLVPPRHLARPDSRGFFICEKCGKGRLRLFVMRRKISESRWRCNVCGAEDRLWASCQHAYASQQQLQKMDLALTTQEPIKPAIISRVYIGDTRIEDAISGGELTPYELAEHVLNRDELTYLEDVFHIDVQNLLLLNDVTAVICTYGYSTGSDAVVKPFEEYAARGRRYKAYAARNEGSAILIKVKSYEGDRFTFLHTVEHALTKACHLLAGVQEGAFMGKVLKDNNMIVIYEASGSEQGGLEHVFKHRLSQLFPEALRIMFTCKYDCGNACPGCVYVRDPLCHPVQGFFIPNSDLNRKLVLSKWTSSR